MKRTTLLVTALSVFLISSAGHAADHSDGTYIAKDPIVLAGLAWRCGKKNPAMWGTFGNGCLKQRRQARKNSASTAVGDLTLPGPPAHPSLLVRPQNPPPVPAVPGARR